MGETERWIDRGWLRIAAILFVLSAVAGLLAANFETFLFDRPLAATIRRFDDPFERVAYVLNEKQAIVAILAFASAAIVLTARHRVHIALLFVFAGALRPLLSELKTLVDRPRPAGDFPRLDAVVDSSFPSGHVMTVAMFFGLWFILAPQILPPRYVVAARVVAAAVIVLTALSRVWAGVHWPSDTAGSLLWVATVLAVVLAFSPTFLRFCAWTERQSLALWRLRTPGRHRPTVDRDRV